VALTIAIEGKGIIANADATPDSAMAGSLWDELGAGTDAFTTYVRLYGTTSFGGAYSAKAGWQYYDIGAANVLDFTQSPAGAQKDQYIWLWVSVTTIGLIQTKANKGLTIRIGSSLTDYREYVIAGSDDANEWKGEWKCFVMDPTLPSTSGMGAGTLNLAAVRYMGFYIDNTALFASPCIFMSQIAVGKGLRITGDSTTAWEDVLAWCTDYPNRAWGMFTEKEGIAFVLGKVFIGDTAQGAATSFRGYGSILKWAKSEFWDGSAWVPSYPVTACGIEVQDNDSFPTTFEDGIIVGTDSGRGGSQFIGDGTTTVSFDLYAGGHADSMTACYGTAFKKMKGTFNFGNDSDHKVYACSFVACSQVDPVGGPEIRNCIFAETADAEGALLWNASINIADCKFIANTIGAAIRHLVGGPASPPAHYDYDALTFSGNTYDIENAATTPNFYIDIDRINGSNPDSGKINNSAGGTTVLLEIGVTLQLTGLVSGSDITILDAGTEDERVNVQENSGTTYNYGYDYAASDYVDIGVFKAGYVPYYVRNYLLAATNGSLPIAQEIDRYYLE